MIRSLSHWRLLAFALALLALTVKAALPAGVMLGERNDRTITFVLCNGGAPVESVLDLHTGAVKPKQDKKSDAAHDAPCAFAAIAAAPAPSQAFLAAPLTRAEAAPAPPRAARPPISEIGPPLAARGPPVSA